MNKHNFDYTESFCLSSLSYLLLCSEADLSGNLRRGNLMRNSSENMQQFCGRIPMQKCQFNKIALHWLLLKPGPRPWP